MEFNFPYIMENYEYLDKNQEILLPNKLKCFSKNDWRNTLYGRQKTQEKGKKEKHGHQKRS
jgi:hypothetical protein